MHTQTLTERGSMLELPHVGQRGGDQLTHALPLPQQLQLGVPVPGGRGGVREGRHTMHCFFTSCHRVKQ